MKKPSPHPPPPPARAKKWSWSPTGGGRLREDPTSNYISCKALTEKILVFRVRGSLLEVVAYESWSHMEIRLLVSTVYLPCLCNGNDLQLAGESLFLLLRLVSAIVSQDMYEWKK